MVNLFTIVAVLLLLLILLIFIILKNKRDKKDLVEKLNNEYRKPRDEEGEADEDLKAD